MNANQKTILIIEDNIGLNELLSEKLQECGFQTYSVYSAMDAFEWFKVNKAFLLLLDFSLPDMNGQEFVESLLAKEYPLPPFIVATGQGDERIAVQMMKLGARDYIRKDNNFLDMIPLLITKVSSEIEKEQKLQQIQLELAESNKFNEQIIKSAQEGIVVFDLDLRHIVWNPFMEKITGVQSKDVLGKYVLEVFPFLEKTVLREKLAQSVKGTFCSEVEFYFTIPETGKSGWVSETFAPLLNAENEIIGVIATIRDITERKQSEEALRQSEELYRNLVEILPDGVYKSTSEGKFIEANPALVKMLGYANKAEMLAIDIKTDLYFKESDREISAYTDLEQGLEAYLLKKKDGSGIWVEDHGWYNRDENGNIDTHEGILRNISERKKIEDALRESERKFSDMAVHSAGVIYQMYARKDGAMGFYYLSPKVNELFGFSTDLFHSDWNLGQHVHPEDKEGFLNAVSESISTISQFSYECRVITLNGIKWVHFLSSPIEKNDEIVFNGIMIDISARIKAKEDLEESETKYRELVENSPDAIAIYIEGQITFVNNACVVLMGAKSNDELIGRSVFEFVHPDSHSTVMQRMGKLKTPGTVLDSQDEKFIRLDNKTVDVEVKAMSLIIEDKLAIQLIVTDITERKKTQNELIERKDLLRKLLFTSTELIDSSSDILNYRHLTDVAKEITGAKYVCFNLFDEDRLCFRTVAFSGLPDVQQESVELLGFELLGKEWDQDLIEGARIKDNTVTEFDSLEMLVGSLIPKTILDKIQKTYSFGKIVVIKISKKNKIVGDFTLMLKEDKDIENQDILELFANQVGLYLERQFSEEKLRKNEEKYRILFAGNPQPMFVYNLKTLNVLEVNQTALDFYGYTRKEFLSMSVKELHSQEGLLIFNKVVAQARLGLKTNRISHHIKKNGQKIIVEAFAVSASFMGQDARHVLVVDISERKLAEEALNKQMDELMRFHQLTVGREHTMIQLKKEINNLLVQYGELEKYKIVE